MTIVVQLFGPLRERLGLDETPLALPDGATARDALAAFVAAHSEAADYYDAKTGRTPLMLIVDGERVALDAALADGAALLLVSPMAGG
ncbi:MAG: MoaD/ThiS family protein [Candidatus Sumerlaeota bacterium]|nr:MoaD/ThiS family protein [Candidatus Sumerlaeota bacterium]